MKPRVACQSSRQEEASLMPSGVKRREAKLRFQKLPPHLPPKNLIIPTQTYRVHRQQKAQDGRRPTRCCPQTLHHLSSSSSSFSPPPPEIKVNLKPRHPLKTSYNVAGRSDTGDLCSTLETTTARASSNLGKLDIPSIIFE